jgi:CDP-4-dehydro-6-deoxyglucose reductase
MQLEHSDSMHLYWIACGKGDQYMHNLVRSWTDAFDNFTYTPLSVPAREEKKDGTQCEHADALAQLLQYVIRDHKQLAQHDLYIAGPSHVTEIASDFLLQQGAPDDQVHSAVTH